MAIAYGGSVVTISASSGTGPSVTGSNTYGVIFASGDTSGDNITGITWGGVAMTKIAAKQIPSDRWQTAWGIVNPGSAATIAVSGGAFFHFRATYYTGVSQVVTPDSSATNSIASGSTTLGLTTTVVATNSWLIYGLADSSGNITYSTNVGSMRTAATDGSGTPAHGDSNATVSTGSNTVTLTAGSGTAARAGIIFSLAPVAATATTFLEPGGDSTFNVATTTAGGFWDFTFGGVSVVNDFVHGNHIKSLKHAGGGTGSEIDTPAGTISDLGTRISIYMYFVAFPASGNAGFMNPITAGLANCFSLSIASTGVLRILNGGVTVIASAASPLSLNTWYRVSVAYTLTSTSVNRIEVFVNGISVISITNASINSIGSSILILGNLANSSTLDFRTSDHYIDNSSSLTDTGDIWVTAKRPFSNGINVDFSPTGSGSGYGSGNAPYNNERPLSTTNFLSATTALVDQQQDLLIESQSAGDINIIGSTIVGYTGWAYANASASVSAALGTGGSFVFKSLTTSNTMITQNIVSASYPLNTGSSGVSFTTNATGVSQTWNVYEMGVMVAFIPANTPFVGWYAALV